jgi:hypothetical protein
MTDWNYPLLLLLESFNYDGTWVLVLGSKMFTSAKLKQWIVLVSSRGWTQSLIATMQRVAGPLGYQIERPEV